ncbi:MAG: hypothetical protein HRT87_08165 [Legionellales bacterium]|nr:hypothetical protein [Legionellales bacterium]
MIQNKKLIIIAVTCFFYALSYANSITFKNSSKQNITVTFMLGQIVLGKKNQEYKLIISNRNNSSLDIKSEEVLNRTIDDLGVNFIFSSKQQVILFPIVTKIVYHGNKNKRKNFSIDNTKQMLSKEDSAGKIVWTKNDSKNKYLLHTGKAYLDVLSIDSKKPFNIWLSINEGKTWRRIT